MSILQPDSLGWFDLPQAKYTYKHTYSYENTKGWLVPAEHGCPPCIITNVVITVERTPADDEVFIDHDAYGYMATKDGQIDKRSKLTRIWVGREWFNPFYDDVELLETPS